MTAVLSGVVWSDFEAEENLLSGTASGETVEATVTETTLTVETSQKDIECIVERGHIAVIPIDICGAITLKNLYRDRAMLVFTRRDRAAAIKSIIGREQG